MTRTQRKNLPDATTVEHRGKNGQGNNTVPATLSEQSLASSAHARINVPLNLDNWRDRTPEEAELLTWFHTILLRDSMSWADAVESIGYDRSTIFRLLKGTYAAQDWSPILKRIRGYRDLYAERRSLQTATFAANNISRAIWGALDYALAANGVTQITGESGQGKTAATIAWQERNNHGKSIYITAPAIGGQRTFLRDICAVIGANRNQSIAQMRDSILRALNPNRILIVDEASRLLPAARTTHPTALEFLRDLHDQTQCGLALITTARFGTALAANEYMFEQLLGRIDMPIRLPRDMDQDAYLPLLQQYIPDPSPALHRLAKLIVNEPLGGRMRRLAKVLKFASRIAAKDGTALEESHIHRSWQYHTQMSGEPYAVKPKKR